MNDGRFTKLLIIVALWISCYQCKYIEIVYPLSRNTERYKSNRQGKYFQRSAVGYDLNIQHEKYQPKPRDYHGNQAFGNWDRIGTYYMLLSIGTPRQTFSVCLDTGSSNLAIPSDLCTQYANTTSAQGNICSFSTTPPYNASSSNTSQAVPCNVPDLVCGFCKGNVCAYNNSYVDGSGYSAMVFNDSIEINGVTNGKNKIYQIFGGIYYEKYNLEPNPIDGIIGLAYQKLSPINASTVVDTLVENKIIKNIFSICFTPKGGIINFGGIAPYFTGDISYTNIVEELYYNVLMADILINGKSLGISPGVYNQNGCIIDSGTTDILIPTEAYQAINETLLSNCAAQNLTGVCYGESVFIPGICVLMNQTQVDQWPVITFTFEKDTKVAVPPSIYLPSGICSDDYRSLTILPTTGTTVMGSNMMQSNKRIGFAPQYKCPES